MEMKIGEHEYSVGRLSARQQYHLARKIAPAVFALNSSRADAAKMLPKGLFTETGMDESKFDSSAEKALALVFGKLADALAGMSEADSDYVINTCLSVCQRKQQGGWQKVMTPNGSMMFEDMDLRTLVQLTLGVIKENLGSFFSAPLGLAG